MSTGIWMAGMMAISSGDLMTCLTAGEMLPSKDNGRTSAWVRTPDPWPGETLLLAFCALRSVALVSLRKIRSNSSL